MEFSIAAALPNTTRSAVASRKLCTAIAAAEPTGWSMLYVDGGSEQIPRKERDDLRNYVRICWTLSVEPSKFV